MRKIAPYGLRLPPKLKEELDEEARANGRSLNSEIVARLEASLQADAGYSNSEERLLALEDQMAKMLKALNLNGSAAAEGPENASLRLLIQGLDNISD